MYIPILQGTLWGLLERWPDLVLRHMNRLDLAQAGLAIKSHPKKPDPDLLVTGMDPRIRIHPEMSWIRNTEKSNKNGFFRFFGVC
jgi:hypothetical protein